jgi:hypothetical protein
VIGILGNVSKDSLSRGDCPSPRGRRIIGILENVPTLLACTSIYFALGSSPLAGAAAWYALFIMATTALLMSNSGFQYNGVQPLACIFRFTFSGL